MTTRKTTVIEEHTLRYFRFKGLFNNDSWLSPAYVGVDADGFVRYLSDNSPEGIAIEAVNGLALPGFQNAHSHAFQYAMAGLAESHPAGVHDDFWSWREAMYLCALSVNPDNVEAVATMLYVEMLRHGYTHVAEFQYLHHDKDGGPYNNLAEMGERLVSAARASGIKLTLIPVFYQKGNFDHDPYPHQRRFISKTVDDYLRLLEASGEVIKKYSQSRLGFSVHSLRAVNLNDVLTTFQHGPQAMPFHIHVAEQKKEVNDCLASCGQRPMQWILNHLPVDDRFYFVHATHLDDAELSGLIRSKGNVVLCPSTEGNLGDGIFRMKEFVSEGGHWCIGTDSHIGLNPMEEYRMIDYRQRLLSHKRNTFERDGASYMIGEALHTGRRAMGLNYVKPFAIGQPLDAIVYDASTALLGNTALEHVAATLVYSPDSGYRLGTLVNGKWVVKQQHHIAEETIRSGFNLAMKDLKNR